MHFILEDRENNLQQSSASTGNQSDSQSEQIKSKDFSHIVYRPFQYNSTFPSSVYLSVTFNIIELVLFVEIICHYMMNTNFSKIQQIVFLYIPNEVN